MRGSGLWSALSLTSSTSTVRRIGMHVSRESIFSREKRIFRSESLFSFLFFFFCDHGSNLGRSFQRLTPPGPVLSTWVGRCLRAGGERFSSRLDAYFWAEPRLHPPSSIATGKPVLFRVLTGVPGLPFRFLFLSSRLAIF